MSISYVQSAQRTGAMSAGTPVPIPFVSANAVGNTIIVFIVEQNGLLANFTVTDSRGNTYTQIGTYADVPADLRRSAVFVARNILAGANTVSYGFDQSAFGSTCIIVEYTGNPAVNPVTNFSSQVTGPTDPTTSSVSLTTQHSNDIVILPFYEIGNSTVSPPAGFIVRQGGLTLFDGCVFLEKVIPTAGLATYTITGIDRTGHGSAILWGLALTTTSPPGSGGKSYVWEM